MIPKQAIAKAKEGGWRPEWTFVPEESDQDGFAFLWAGKMGALFITWQEIALDRTFWQALGKALGWPEYAPICHRCGNIRKERYDTSCLDGQCELTGYDNSLVWNMYAHRFYDLVLTDHHIPDGTTCLVGDCHHDKKAIEDFWADLLPKNK